MSFPLVICNVTHHAHRFAVVEPLADGYVIAGVLGQYGPYRADMGCTVMLVEVAVTQLAGRGVDHQPCLDAPSADGKDVLLVAIPAGPDTEFTQDAAVEVDGKVGVAGIHQSLGIEVGELGSQHAAVIGHGLQLAGATLFAAGADVIALDKQQLKQGATHGHQLLCVVFHLCAVCCRGGAGGQGSAIHFHGTEPAAAMGAELRVVAEVRDVDAGGHGGIHDGLPILKRDLDSVDGEVPDHTPPP